MKHVLSSGTSCGVTRTPCVFRVGEGCSTLHFADSKRNLKPSRELKSVTVSPNQKVYRRRICHRQISLCCFAARSPLYAKAATGSLRGDAKSTLVVLDWDGTVVDSISHIVHSWDQAYRDNCVGLTPSKDQIRRCIGMSIDVTVQTNCPGETASVQKAICESYRDYFRSGKESIKMYPGARVGLEQLIGRGMQLAVATGKSRRGLDDELDIHDAGPLFVASRTSDMTQSKPHPQMLLEILHETGFSPADTIMVGDSALDMQLAQNAGVLGIGVGFGAELEADLMDSGASFCAQTWPELVRHIEGLVA